MLAFAAVVVPAAHVTFKNTQNAKLALEQMNGFEVVAGWPIRVGVVADAVNPIAAPLPAVTGVPGGFNLPATGAYFPPAGGLAVPPMMPLATGAVPVAAAAAAAAAAARPARPVDKSGPSGAPSKCVVLRNLFDPLEETAPNWVRAPGRMVRPSKGSNMALTMLGSPRRGVRLEQDTEIRDDVEAECAKQGRVLHIALDKQSRVRPPAEVAAWHGARYAHHAGRVNVRALGEPTGRHRVRQDGVAGRGGGGRQEPARAAFRRPDHRRRVCARVDVHGAHGQPVDWFGARAHDYAGLAGVGREQ